VLGLLGVDDLAVVSVETVPDEGSEIERWLVTMAGPDGEVTAAVESRPSGEPALLTCRATHPAHFRSWHVSLVGAGA
jgi:hypothetical protein